MGALVSSCCCVLPAFTAVPPQAAKFVYLAQLIAAFALAAWFRTGGGDDLERVYDYTSCETVTCRGQQAVFRVSFALFVFFATTAIITKFVRGFHSNLWGPKFLYFLGLLAVTIVIPDSFFHGYAEFARVGSILFIILQVIMLIDMAYNIHDQLLERAEAYDEQLANDGYVANICGNKWRVLYLICCIGCIGCIGAATAIMFIRQPGCGLNIFFIAWMLLLGIGFTLLSLSSRIGKGLLTPCVVWGHSAYLCFTMIASNPNPECNASANSNTLQSIIIGTVIAALGLVWTTFRMADAGYNVFNQQKDVDKNNAPTPGIELPSVSVNVTSDMTSPSAFASPNSADDQPPVAIDQQYWFFHTVMALSGLYLAMLLTNWATSVQTDTLTANTELSVASMWIKFSAQLVAVLLYVWTLIAPAMFPDRDFGGSR